MTQEVEWVLDQLASVVANQSEPLKRIDRDNSQTYEGSQSVDQSSPIHTRVGELEDANLVGVASVDREPSPIGTEFDYELETVVAVRLEGLHTSEFGHVDPSGSDGVVWSSLVADVRGAILADRTYPDAGRSGVTYTHLVTTNETDSSDDYGDFYRYDFDVVFHGYETLP